MNSEDHQLFQLLDRELFKKAAQFVSSLQKRYPSATYYKILDQYVKFRQSPTKYSFEKGLKQILDAKSPPSDAKSLSMCHRFILELGFDTSRALEPYERAMMKYANSETCYDWFLESLKDLNWRHLCKSSFQMSKVNEKSKSRLFQFWNSVATVVWIQLDKGSLSEKELDIVPRLVYKLTSDLKPFENEQELIVYCKVCELFGDDKSREIVDEIIKFWKEGTFLDLYLKNFLMDHLKKLEEHKLTWKYGISLLNNLDDYGILQNIIEAGHKMDKPFADVMEVLKQKSSRNYMLARVYAAKLYGSEQLDEVLFQFIEKYHDKPSCPVDLQSLDMDKDKLRAMFEKLPSGLIHDKAMSELFGKGDHLQLFLKYKDSLSTKPKTDYSDCSYFVLEIVKNLCADSNITLQNVVASISILEGYQNVDPFNYDTRVWLVLLYTYMGLPEKAYSHLQTLNIKNVQNDLVYHWLYTRYSTILPNKNYSYCQNILAPQSIYASLKNMSGFLVAAFERKSWCKVPGIIDFYERMFKSFTRWSIMAETLQLSRLLNEKKLDQYKPLIESLQTFGMENFHEMSWSDNRDFQIFDQRGGEDVSSPTPTFHKIMAPIRVDTAWLKISIARELIFYSLAKNEKNKFVDDTLAQEETLTKSLSTHELWTWRIIRLLYESLDSSDSIDYKRLAQLIETCPPFVESTWEANHSYLITLATLKSLDQLKRIKDKDLRQLIKNKIKETRDSCTALFGAYKDLVNAMAASPNPPHLHSLFEATAYQNLAPEIAQEIAQGLKAVRNI